MSATCSTSGRPTYGFSRVLNKSAPHLVAQVHRSRRQILICRSTSGQQLGIVLTGGSKGLGFALAQEFLAAGDKVVICGRNEERLKAAERSLRPEFPEQLSAVVCDVSKADEVDRLMEFSQGKLGTIHR